MSEPILLGVRHHGPGSAKAVRRALSACRPQIVLIEGPAEADAIVGLAGHERMRAPVALLAYPDGDRRAPAARAGVAVWPFAEFSPEWQAIRWALANDVPVRFIDLPAGVRIALDAVPADAVPADAVPADAVPSGSAAPEEPSAARVDPIAALAHAAGYDDPERWWEDAVEHRFAVAQAGVRTDEERMIAALAPFEAIAQAMAEVRACAPQQSEAAERDQERREASMRNGIRAAMKQYETVAVVCGAWHVPALAAPMPPASADARALRGLPKARVTMTWVPWTHARLVSFTGYAAGVSAPGWYHHLFTAPDHPVARWLVKAAGVLRAEGVEVSSDHVIEATRLARTLATMRGRPLAGLAEVTEAAGAVLCGGEDLRLALINRRLVVGERLGRVPETTEGVPLMRDLSATRRRLRLALDPLPREMDLDLRREIDLERGRLLRRLRLLGVEWGQPLPARRGIGTFWESWKLVWQPEFAVDLIAAGAYGANLLDAASARVSELARQASTLGDVTALVEQCLLADLADTLPSLLRALSDRVAVDHDVAHLMDAVPALARTLRYGDVRGTDTSALRGVALGIIIRICVGLPGALRDLDDAAAKTMRDRIDAVHAAVGLLEAQSISTMWRDALASLAGAYGLPGLIEGRVNRLLLDAGLLDASEAGDRMALTLTVGVPVSRAAAWVEGFLAGEGLLLVHDERLLHLVDQWLSGIPQESFVEVLPLLRRTFSRYPAPERRMVGERAARIGARDDASRREGASHMEDDPIDALRGSAVLATVAAVLGWT